MNIHSLGYRTDLFFPRFDGEVTDRGDYIVIRTTSNPTYHWGNFLLFSQPPAAGDLERWLRLFAAEIGAPNLRFIQASYFYPSFVFLSKLRVFIQNPC